MKNFIASCIVGYIFGIYTNIIKMKSYSNGYNKGYNKGYLDRNNLNTEYIDGFLEGRRSSDLYKAGYCEGFDDGFELGKVNKDI